MVLSRKRMKPLDRHTALGGVPVLNHSVRLEEKDDGGLILRVTIPRGTSFLDRFRPPEMIRKFELDELGAFVVRLIDGKRSVMDIVDAFGTEHKAGRRETQLSVVTFLKTLVTRNIAAIAIP